LTNFVSMKAKVEALVQNTLAYIPICCVLTNSKVVVFNQTKLPPHLPLYQNNRQCFRQD